jgi:undecaprenyl-diphosphatase
MPLYQVLVLAIVQSVTEFLPISSTAHLALAPWLLGWKDPGLTFDIALHLGTLAAIVIYFFRDWVQLIASGLGLPYQRDAELSRNPRLLWLLALATLPAGLAGAIFHRQAEGPWRGPYVIGGMLIAVGVLMYFADKLGRRQRDLGGISLPDSLVIGLAQAVAIIPGTSRSGITISAALLRGLDRPAAARFSFLLSAPVLAGAAAKALWDLRKQGGIPPESQLSLLVGLAVSALTGWLVIGLFLRFLKRHGLKLFVYYRIIFGIIVIALAILFSRTAG